jgi:hypothetical protein
VRAIASYERTQASYDSPFDCFIAGDRNAIDDSAKHGWELFNTQGRRNKCHALTEEKRDVATFTDNDFHNIGIGIIRHNVVALARQAEQFINSGNTEAIDRAAIEVDMSALGRFLVTKKKADIAAFKTPDVRNVLVTGPYFHDGSQETLWDVVDHYNKSAGLHNPYLDQDIQPLALTEQDIDDLVAFLASLTSADYREQGSKSWRDSGSSRGQSGYGTGVRSETAPPRSAQSLILRRAETAGCCRTRQSRCSARVTIADVSGDLFMPNRAESGTPEKWGMILVEEDPSNPIVVSGARPAARGKCQAEFRQRVPRMSGTKTSDISNLYAVVGGRKQVPAAAVGLGRAAEEEPPIVYPRTEPRRGSRYLNGWPWCWPLLMAR